MIETKKYKVFDKDDSCEYTIEVIEEKNHREYLLYYSMNSLWTRPGELILSLVDDGNGIKLSSKLGNSLDYDVMTELYLLLSIMRELDCERGSQGKYKILEAKNEIIV
jgi:hypothetical protein